MERDPEPFYNFFLCPSAGIKQGVVVFFFKHIKFEILMIYRERKRERERKSVSEGGVVAGGFKHDANHLEWGAEVASTACSV